MPFRNVCHFTNGEKNQRVLLTQNNFKNMNVSYRKNSMKQKKGFGPHQIRTHVQLATQSDRQKKNWQSSSQRTYTYATHKSGNISLMLYELSNAMKTQSRHRFMVKTNQSGINAWLADDLEHASSGYLKRNAQQYNCKIPSTLAELPAEQMLISYGIHKKIG